MDDHRCEVIVAAAAAAVARPGGKQGGGGCCGWDLLRQRRCQEEGQAMQARRERAAKNDRRSRDFFRGISALRARVELEAALKTAEELSREGVAARSSSSSSSSRSGSRSSKRTRSSFLLPAAAEAEELEDRSRSISTSSSTSSTSGKSSSRGRCRKAKVQRVSVAGGIRPASVSGQEDESTTKAAVAATACGEAAGETGAGVAVAASRTGRDTDRRAVRAQAAA
ncbi:unnamed protein product, partial [Pylaiella littoralis]